MGIKKMDGSLLKACFIHSAAVLRKNKSIVDALNVFPVPDGDTGTNMSLTMDQAAKELEKIDSGNLKKTVDALAWGSLMGARGNSGVILSQLFRGFAQSISAHKEHIGTLDIADALRGGVDAAYRAVMRPVEGTILTVARETAEKMLQESKHIEDIEVMLENSIKHGKKVLEKTPKMLKVLEEAKVVDAGGKGFIIILSGMLEAIKNPNISLEYTETTVERETVNIEKPTSYETELKFMYCTEFFITGDKMDTQQLRDQLIMIGDSIVVVGEEQLIKVHVHTNNPGQVLEMAVAMGELSDIKIDNMKLQHRETIIDMQKETDSTDENERVNPQREIGIVAVSPGEGLSDIFRSMEAEVLEGGQSMNPSTESILMGIKKLGAKHAIILPNNKNIIMTAQQVSSLEDNEVVIVPTKSIPQGIAAMLAFNPSMSLQENTENMTKAISTVITGEVTHAVRDSQYNGECIKEGDVLGIEDGKLLMVGSDEQQVLRGLVDHMVIGKTGGIITIYYGKDVDEASASDLCRALSAKFDAFDIEYYDGGQSLYKYIVSVE